MFSIKNKEMRKKFCSLEGFGIFEAHRPISYFISAHKTRCIWNKKAEYAWKRLCFT